MDTILFMAVLATVFFCVGILVGAGLYTGSMDRQCRRMAELVRSLNESGTVVDGKPVN
jgi:hypothetical protein